MSLHRRAALTLPLASMAAFSFGLRQAAAASTPEVATIWPADPPTPISWTGAETIVEQDSPLGRKIQVISNVTVPSVTIFHPAKGRGSGAAMIVMPGGAFGALAWDLEGTEVAAWLAERGVTAFVLKYRVGGADPALLAQIAPLFARPEPGSFDKLAALLEPRRQIAVEDALQAIRFVRTNAAKYAIFPDRIGVMGFSAGGMTTMGVVLQADGASRPNFAAPIYGASKADRPPPKDGPPLFLVHAEDDPTVPVGKSVEIFQSWTGAGLPAELHIYPTGGHGFGLGKKGTGTEDWPRAFEAWLQRQGLLSNPSAPAKK
jgi:acetyl esterase/lipase